MGRFIRIDDEVNVVIERGLQTESIEDFERARAAARRKQNLRHNQ